MEMELKNKEIKKLITRIANKTLGITEEQVQKAMKMYENDPRTLDEIEQELESISKEISEATRKKIEAKRQNHLSQIQGTSLEIGDEGSNTLQSHLIDIPESTHQMTSEDSDDYYKTEILELDELKVDTEEYVNEEPILIPQNDNLHYDVNKSDSNELASMFSQNETQSQTSYHQTQEKGKQLVKKQNSVNNSNGFSSAMNLAFILSVVSILGLFIASVVILLNK